MKIPKWVLWVGGIMLLSYCSYNVNRRVEESPALAVIQHAAAKPAPTKQVPAAQPNAGAAPATMKQLTDASSVMQNLKPEECTPELAETCISLLNSFADALWTVQQSNLTPEQQTQASKFRESLVEFQERMLPILRNSYGKVLRDKLWEHDVDVQVHGTGNRTIEFIGGTFAANRNIKEMNDNIWPLLRKLRFTRAEYRWMKGGDGHYFTLADTDATVLTWDDGNHIIEVK